MGIHEDALKAVGINVLRNAVHREAIARLLEFHINRVAR